MLFIIIDYTQDVHPLEMFAPGRTKKELLTYYQKLPLSTKCRIKFIKSNFLRTCFSLENLLLSYFFTYFSIIVHVTGRSKPSFQNATPATSFANTASSFFSREVSSSSQILYVNPCHLNSE